MRATASAPPLTSRLCAKISSAVGLLRNQPENQGFCGVGLSSRPGWPVAGSTSSKGTPTLARRLRMRVSLAFSSK
jgi:hypothetical protein